MARRRRNCRFAVVDEEISLEEIKIWRNPPEGLIAFLEEILRKEKPKATDESLFEFRHFRKMQDEGNPEWVEWFITRAVYRMDGVFQVIKALTETRMAPKCRKDLEDIIKRLVKKIKALIKEIRSTEALEELKRIINDLGGIDVFEILIGLDVREHGLSKVVADILVINTEKMTEQQNFRIICRNFDDKGDEFQTLMENCRLGHRQMSELQDMCACT